MTDTQSKELKVREKQEVASPAEQTTPGLVFTPAVDIFEMDKEITLLADMPGVKADDLTIDLRDKTLTLSADIAPADNKKMPSMVRMIHHWCLSCLKKKMMQNQFSKNTENISAESRVLNIGIAAYPSNAELIESLINHAAKELSASKNEIHPPIYKA
jgi:hypothetical protein